MLTAVSGAWADASGSCGTDVTYSYVSSTKILTISGTGEMTDYNIPSNRPWIDYVNGITSVVIGAGVTKIGMGAFASCANLTTVTFDGTPTLTSIGALAFDGCTKLESITLPSGVTRIDNAAFNGCIGLTTINIPASVTDIYGSAFYGCINLASISFAANTPLKSTNIGSNAFYECTNLKTLKISGTGAIPSYENNQPWISIKDQITTVTIESGVTAIGDDAFLSCTNLASVTIPATVTSIGQWAFNGCSSLTAFNVAEENTNYSSADGVLFNKAKTTLIKYPAGNTATSYTIPATVTTVGNEAFLSCTKLTSVTIPASVTSIGTFAFDGCTNLASVSFAANTPLRNTNIGTDAFQDCTKLKTLKISGTGAMPNYANNQPWISLKDQITTVTIESGVTAIGVSAFASCANLASVTIPASVTSIGQWAFYECSKLTTVTFDGTSELTTISDGAFKKCAFTSFTIPANVTTIGNEAFNDCTNLASISFAANTQLKSTNIGNNAFLGCTKLKTLKISGTGEMADYNSANQPWKSFRDQITTVTIESGVAVIGASAFEECTNLASVTIPATMISIGDNAFIMCSKLASVNIPASVTAIGNYAFNGCSSLTAFNVADGNANYSSDEIGVLFDKAKTKLIQYPASNTATSYTIPASVTTIYDRAFYQCTNLASVSIPASVTYIDEYAFNGSASLTAFNVAEGNAKYSSDAAGVLFNKAKTTLIQYPAGNTATSYTIPATVTSIGYNAFLSCTNLTSVTIPANVTSIGHTAFKNCTNLVSVIVNATTPPTLLTEVFEENASGRKIYVPSASVETYKGTTRWNDYESAIEAFPTVASGTCGTEGHESEVRWEISGFANNYLLTISGTGEMEGYNPGKQPWKDYDGGITTVVIGNGVTNIGRNICYEYTTLTYVSIPASVTSIGEQAFEGCTNLTSITIPAGVTSIGEEAFFGCSSLSSINIPAGIETFDRSWFNGCSSLTAINVAEGNANYASADGVLFNKAKTTLILYPFGKEANPYTIPSTVTTIGDDAFSWSTKLTSVSIPASVTTIGKGAFSMSENLASVTFAAGSSLTSISDNAFFDCDNLTSFTIPAGVTSIGARAFGYCSKLTSISIPAGVTCIGESAFSTCVKLPSITLPASVTTIGNSAFYQCVELATVTLNSSPLIGEEAFDILKSGAVVAINAPAHDAASYQWATFYNKTCSFKADANTQVFKVTLAGSTVTLLEVTDKIVNAGTAVVLKSTGTPVMTLTTASSSDMQGNDLVGTSATIINPGNAYVLNYTAADGVGFYMLASTGTIEFGKAYLVASAAAREFLTFGETTGLSPIPSPKGEGSDVIYDIHGRRVNGKPSKGLYIINGKKVVL